MVTVLRLLLALLLLMPAAASHGERATERYAPAQLRVAQDLLQRAHAAAALGNFPRAGKLAWQANLDARLAWAMTESERLRADAARIGGAAADLIARLARRADQ
jgi:hypothetical protein